MHILMYYKTFLAIIRGVLAKGLEPVSRKSQDFSGDIYNSELCLETTSF